MSEAQNNASDAGFFGYLRGRVNVKQPFGIKIYDRNTKNSPAKMIFCGYKASECKILCFFHIFLLIFILEIYKIRTRIAFYA